MYHYSARSVQGSTRSAQGSRQKNSLASQYMVSSEFEDLRPAASSSSESLFDENGNYKQIEGYVYPPPVDLYEKPVESIYSPHPDSNRNYAGVQKKRDKFIGAICVSDDRKTKCIGTFASQDDAADAVAQYRSELGLPLHTPSTRSNKEHYHDVTKRSGGKWEACFSRQDGSRRKEYVGLFDTPEAAQAAAQRRREELNMPRRR